MAREGTNGAEGHAGGTESDVRPIILDSDGGASASDDDSRIPTVEPASLIIEPEPGDAPKRRGRKPGSRNAAKPAQTKEVQGDISALLYSGHLMLAALCKTSELQLEKEEADNLAKAVARVNAEFGGMVFDPKTAALLNLGMVGVGIYVPRAIAIVNNKKKKKAEQAKAQTQVIQ